MTADPRTAAAVVIVVALLLAAAIAVVKLRDYRDTDRRDNRHDVMPHLARARNHRKGRG